MNLHFAMLPDGSFLGSARWVTGTSYSVFDQGFITNLRTVLRSWTSQGALTWLALMFVKEEPHLAQGMLPSGLPLGHSRGLHRPASSACETSCQHRGPCHTPTQLQLLCFCCAEASSLASLTCIERSDDGDAKRQGLASAAFKIAVQCCFDMQAQG